MDPLGGWTTARRCPRTPGRGSAPVKRHSRIAVAGEQPHPRSRMGRSRRQTHRTTPIAGIGGLRRAAAQHPSSPPRTRRSGATPPTEEAATWPPATHLGTGRSIPRCQIPSPKWAAPAAHKQPGGPESFSGKETAHSGSSQNLLYSGASRAGMALAHSATPPPPSTPKSPSPDPGAIPQGDTGGMDTPRGRQTGAGSIPAPLGDHPTSDGTQTRPRPLVPRRFGPALTQPLYKMTLETLHKHLETRLKIMVHHPKIYKTSKELILHSIKHRRLGEGDRRH
jgi:hypothetical protein